MEDLPNNNGSCSNFNLDALNMNPVVKKKVEDEIKRLKRELSKASDNCFKAGLFGKNLLEEKQHLTKEIDRLMQDKYSLSQKLALKETVTMGQTTDVFDLQEQLNLKNQAIKEFHVKEKELDIKIRGLKEQVQESENREEDLKVKLIKEQQCAEDLIKQINGLKEKEKIYNNSLESTYSDDNDYEALKTKNGQIMTVYLQSQDMLKERVNEFESLKLDMEALRCELAHKDEKISSLSTLVDEYKADIENLQLEIECGKSQEIDINKRGNCIFAEVEDHRVLLEKKLSLENERYKKLSAKFNQATENISKKNVQIMTLLNLKGQNGGQSWTKELESNLLHARKEISELQSKLNAMTDESSEARKPSKSTYSSDHLSIPQQSDDDSNLQLCHLNLLLSKDREELIKKDREVKSLTFNLALHKEQLTSVQIKLHNSQEEIKFLKSEVLKLTLLLKSLKRKTSESPEECKERKNSTIVEKIAVTEDRNFKSMTIHPLTEIQNEATNNSRSPKLSKNVCSTISASAAPSVNHVTWCESVDNHGERKTQQSIVKSPKKSLNNKILKNKDMESVTECKQQ